MGDIDNICITSSGKKYMIEFGYHFFCFNPIMLRQYSPRSYQQPWLNTLPGQLFG
jgi:hypothetical protein